MAFTCVEINSENGLPDIKKNDAFPFKITMFRHDEILAGGAGAGADIGNYNEHDADDHI